MGKKTKNRRISVLSLEPLQLARRLRPVSYTHLQCDCFTVGEIMKLMEGSLAPVACLDRGAAPCLRAEECLTLPMWRHLDSIIDQYLSSITIQDLIDGTVK